jgi:predicted glycosyltransferase
MRNFDIIMVGDFRFPGGTSIATAHEIRALAGAGLSIGLVQSNAPVLRMQRPMNPVIRACVERNEAEVIPAGEKQAEARLGILHNPMAFTGAPEGLPRFSFKSSILVAHQNHTDRNGLPYYDTAAVDAICREICGSEFAWAPISPVVRKNLRLAKPSVALTLEDWHNTVFPEEWAADRAKPLSGIPVLGRHGRADKDKWPASRSEILTVYPDDPAIEVRLLGAGDYLKRVMGDYPSNWTALRFGQMAPQDFVKTIDFFLYYHHPDLVEAFGRTVIEAVASGCVAILPPHFEETFGEVALYREAGEAVGAARELHGNWRQFLAQSKRGQKLVAERYGPARHVRFIRQIMGPAPGPAAVAHRATKKKKPDSKRTPAMPAPSSLHLVNPAYDVVILADMRNPGDVGLRIAHEIRIQHGRSFRTALIHLPSGRIKSNAVRGEINACVREGMAEVLTPSDTVSARLLVIHGPEDALEPIPERLPRVMADKIVVVVTRPPDRSYSLLRKHRLLALAFQKPPVWAPATPYLRDCLLKAWPEVPLDLEDWSVALAQRSWKERVFKWDRPVVGRIESEAPLDFGKTDKAEVKPAAPPSFPGCYVRVLQAQPVTDDPPGGLLDKLQIEEQAVGKFLDGLDFLLIEQDDMKPAPLTTIAEAMQRGVIVLAKPDLARDLGAGAIACGPGKAEEIVRTMARQPAELAQLARDASRNASARFAEAAHVDRIARLTAKIAAPAVASKPRRQRIAFITSNGVGLGHLTRLLCIARRLPPEIDPIFVTMSQAFGIVRDFGFPVEYVPFSSQSEASGVVVWNDWFKQHVEQIFDAYGITGAVFDGGAPYGGLVRAISSRPDFFSVWVRRGMWKPGRANDNLVKRQKHFDLVIEPRDVADVRDNGPTSFQYGRSAHVDPIRLLDYEELLDRRAAAKALGIDHRRPAVLVQLGSGNTSEIVSQTNEIIKACGKFSKLQVVIAEWAIGAVAFDVWPQVKVLRGFPLSRYFNAFDFTISAVGYNSFNELISFGLPAIFLANENPIMDDQAGRAAFAVDQGAAFQTSPEQIKDLHLLIGAMMDERARAVIKVNAARIALANGAQAAADLIVKLAGVVPAPAREARRDVTKARTKVKARTTRRTAARAGAKAGRKIKERA